MNAGHDDSERIVTTYGDDSARSPHRRRSRLSPRQQKAGAVVLVALVLAGVAVAVAAWSRSPQPDVTLPISSAGAVVTASPSLAVPGRDAPVPSAPVATKVTEPVPGRTPGKSPSPTATKKKPVDTSTDVARGKPVQESGHTEVYQGRNVTDGSSTSYWEGPGNTFPASVTIDLGQVASLGRVVLELPPRAEWNSRVQTLSVSGSADGHTFSTLSGSAPHTFDAATGNKVTLRFTRTQKRFLKVVITANAGWPAGQLSEVEAYAG
jgi:hypothetical protein